MRFHCWCPRARGPFSRQDVSKHEFEEIDRSARRRRADVAAEDQGSDGRGCGDGAREASESAARANGGAGRRALRCEATRHGRECERIASVARAPSRASAHNDGTVTTRAKIIARARAPTRPCGAARRGASAAQLDAARLDAARRARSPQMPKKQTTGEAAGGPRSKKMSSEKARRVVSNPRRSIEDARLKPLHHPGKQALLDPGSCLINKGAT